MMRTDAIYKSSDLNKEVESKTSLILRGVAIHNIVTPLLPSA